MKTMDRVIEPASNFGGSEMPQSKLIQNLRYGWTGRTVQGYPRGPRITTTLSADANLYLADDVKERVSVLPDGGIWLQTLFTGKDILLSESAIAPF